QLRGADEEIREVVADIGDDELLELGRQRFGAAEGAGRLGPCRRCRRRKEARRQRVELVGLLLRRPTAPRIGVAGGDEQRIRAVDAARLDQKLEGFVGLEAEHEKLRSPGRRSSKNDTPDYSRQFVSRLLTLTIP